MYNCPISDSFSPNTLGDHDPGRNAAERWAGRWVLWFTTTSMTLVRPGSQ